MKKIILIILIGIVTICCTNNDFENEIEQNESHVEAPIVLKFDKNSVFNNEALIHEIKEHSVIE